MFTAIQRSKRDTFIPQCMTYSLLLQVIRFLNATEDEWEVPRCEIEVGAKLGEGSYGAVFKGQLTVTAMTPMIHAHKKEMDFEGKSHLNVAVKILQRKHTNTNVYSVCHCFTKHAVITEGVWVI